MTDHWLVQLHTLLERFNQLGIDADVSNLSLSEKWGLFLHLSRLADI